MSNWQLETSGALMEAQRACQQGDVHDALWAADRAMSLLLAERDARDARVVKREEAWKALLAEPRPKPLDPGEQRRLREGFLVGWRLATAAASPASSPAPPPDGYAASLVWSAEAQLDPLPQIGTYQHVKHWADAIEGQCVAVQVDGVAHDIGKIKYVNLKRLPPIPG